MIFATDPANASDQKTTNFSGDNRGNLADNNFTNSQVVINFNQFGSRKRPEREAETSQQLPLLTSASSNAAQNDSNEQTEGSPTPFAEAPPSASASARKKRMMRVGVCFLTILAISLPIIAVSVVLACGPGLCLSTNIENNEDLQR